MAENKKKKVKLRIKRNPLQSVPDEEIGRFVDEAIERIDLDRPVAENVKPSVRPPSEVSQPSVRPPSEVSQPSRLNKKIKLRIETNPLQNVPDEEIGRFVDEAIERIDLDRPVAENVKPNVTQPHSLLKMHRWNQLGEYIAPKAEFPTMREARRLAGRVGARLFGGPAALRQTIENQRLAEIARIDRAKAIAAARAERGAMYRQALGGRLSRKATAKALGTATVRGIPRSLGLIGRVALGPIGMGLGSALDYYEVGRQIAARGDLKEAQEHIREQGKGLEEKGFRVLQRRTGDVEIAEPGELPEWAENLPDSDLIRMVRKKRQMLQLERELEMRRDAREKKLKAIAQQRKEIPQQRALRR